MIVAGVQRQRSQKRSAAEQILFAGFFLALSTQAVSHQDALFRFEAGVAPTERWQVHMEVRNGPEGSNRKYATMIGPGMDQSTSVPLDRMTTGAVRTAAASIDRLGKSDSMKPTRPVFNAGFMQGSELFDPIDTLPKGTMVAFVKPTTGGAPAKAVKDGANRAIARAVTNDGASEAEAAEPATPTLIAYAPADDEPDAPFDAVIGGEKKKVILEPGIAKTHAWVNYTIPENSLSAKERKCLAEAIYFEARGESERGQIGVAQVVINRLKNPAYPNTICSVVYQNKQKRNRCQFSFACDGIPERINDRKSWTKAKALADRILDDDRLLYIDEVGASTHYHATYVRPRWARSMRKKERIGRHIFYQTRGGGWS